jgi:DNA-binding PadR family transcriptional regulator
MSPMQRLPPTLEHALLGFLVQQPMHGYEIYQRLSCADGLGLVWDIKQSQLYALLNKLEQMGYVTAHLEPQETRPTRKVYELTGTGCAAFNQWLESPVPQGRRFRMEFLAKLFFAQQAGSASVKRLLDHQQAACRRWMHYQEEHMEQPHQEEPFDWLVYRFRMGQVQAMLDWLELCRSTLLEPSGPAAQHDTPTTSPGSSAGRQG